MRIDRQFCRLGWVLVLGIGLLLGGCTQTEADGNIPPGDDLYSAATISTIEVVSPVAVSSPTTTPRPLPSPTTIPATPSITLSGSSLPSLAGDLENQIAGLEEHMPRAGSNRFVVPSDNEKNAFSELTARIESGNIDQAAAIANQYNYELLRYIDHSDEDSESWMLRELKPIQKGWGLYLFRVSTSNDFVIEAPHPLDDDMTSSVALDVYRALNARALLIAGASRDAKQNGMADVAHNPETIFQAIHTALVAQGSPLVLQIHGFTASKHPGYPEAVFGSDQRDSDELLNRLAEAMETQGIRAGVCDGVSWRDLCGETNIQSSTMQNGIFIHIELDKALRAQDDTLLAALMQVIR